MPSAAIGNRPVAVLGVRCCSGCRRHAARGLADRALRVSDVRSLRTVR